jgi:hypothetical protein
MVSGRLHRSGMPACSSKFLCTSLMTSRFPWHRWPAVRSFSDPAPVTWALSQLTTPQVGCSLSKQGRTAMIEWSFIVVACRPEHKRQPFADEVQKPVNPRSV